MSLSLEQIILYIPFSVLLIILFTKHRDLNSIEIEGKSKILKKLQENEKKIIRNIIYRFYWIFFLYLISIVTLTIINLFFEISGNIWKAVYVIMAIVVILAFYFVIIKIDVDKIKKITRKKELSDLNIDDKELIGDFIFLENLCENIKKKELRERIHLLLTEILGEKLE